MYTLTNSINWAQPYVQYSPLTAGLGFEPSASTASMIRNSMLNAPMTWAWNRKEDASLTTTGGTPGQQDYTVALPDFGFLEKCSMKDPDTSEVFELKDIYNTSALGVSSFQQRPNAVAVIAYTPGTNVKIRFMGVPDKAYPVTLTYQLSSPLFGPFTITAVANAVAGNTTYTGFFAPLSLPAAATATITGCTNAVNNGSFTIVSCSATTLVVANTAGVTETPTTAFALNLSWSPIPDQYSDIYNNLFLSEAFANTDDARAQIYRQRGVAAFLSKAEGLTETQRNAFVQQWLARSLENAGVLLKLQQATQARGL